jgi:hypothetical protein
MMVKNGLGFRYYFSKSQADYWLSAFSKAKLRLAILFEVPLELEIFMLLPVKSPNKSFYISKQELKKYFFLTLKMQKIKNHQRT